MKVKKWYVTEDVSFTTAVGHLNLQIETMTIAL